MIMAKGTEVAKRDDGGVDLSPELVQRFASMAMAIPEDDGSATERILEQLLSADNADDLNAPWEVTKARGLAGTVFRVDGLKRQQSSFSGGLGVFLVVSYTDTQTGAQSVFTTSSVTVVAQLVRAFHLFGLPFNAELVIAERPSASGFYPHHLKVWGAVPQS